MLDVDIREIEVGECMIGENIILAKLEYKLGENYDNFFIGLCYMTTSGVEAG